MDKCRGSASPRIMLKLRSLVIGLEAENQRNAFYVHMEQSFMGEKRLLVLVIGGFIAVVKD